MYNIMKRVLILLCSIICCLCQGPWTGQGPSEVPALNYEVANALLNSDSQSFLLVGCDNALQRVFDLTKLVSTSNFTVVCMVADICEKVKDVTDKLNIVAVHCGQLSRDVRMHDAVLFAQSSACEDDECLSNRSSAEELAGRVYMVWDSSGPNDKLIVSMKVPQKVEYYQKNVPAADVFSHVYSNNLWGKAGGGSGIGSNPASTAKIRPKIAATLKKYKIKSVVDAPCGSMAWMPLILETFPELTYTGLDVACEEIARHQVNYASKRNWRFYCVDVCHQGLPRADLVFSRDAMQHLPLSYVHAFLRNVKSSGAKFLLVGSYLNLTSTKFRINVDIPVGAYFNINLLEKPFSLGHALIETLSEEVEYKGYHHKSMLLFDASKL